jgi:hypothetical protein
VTGEAVRPPLPPRDRKTHDIPLVLARDKLHPRLLGVPAHRHTHRSVSRSSNDKEESSGRESESANAPAENVVEFGREVNVVLFEVGVQVIRAEHFRNLDQLILCESPSISALRRKRKKERERSVTVRVTVEEGFFAEDHARKHAPERPHVERVVVLCGRVGSVSGRSPKETDVLPAPQRLTLKVDEEFRALEVPRRDPDVVLCPGVVKLC